MAERQGQQHQRRKQGRQHQHQRNDRNDRGDQKEQTEKRRPFVPWLGEERPSKGPILDLKTYENEQVNVVFVGGREIEGKLTGYDTLMNLVLEDVVENLGGGKTRKLGTLVARGPLLQSFSPVKGSEYIDNPF